MKRKPKNKKEQLNGDEDSSSYNEDEKSNDEDNQQHECILILYFSCSNCN